MHRAVDASDASFDGLFVVAVRTTGIFCRPSCPARKPLPRNRVFYATADEALAAGYRPCKRCHPLDVSGRPPEWLAPLLADVESDPSARRTDADLRALGLDPSRVRRWFRAHYGMTFQTFCRGRRMTQALEQLRGGAGLDEVALGNGYESHSGFRDAFVRAFGQPPGRGRKAGCLVVHWVESPLGSLVVGATDDGVCLLEFSDPERLDAQLAALRRQFDCPVAPGWNDHLERLAGELTAYFAGKLTAFGVPLDCPGTPFQRTVWAQLLKIPYGETRSYKNIAGAVGAPLGSRAVGRANGQNRVAVVIPCHRVVNNDGRLGGYGGGLWRKQFLLDLERGAHSAEIHAR